MQDIKGDIELATFNFSDSSNFYCLSKLFLSDMCLDYFFKALLNFFRKA